jgi:hypothetical protein
MPSRSVKGADFSADIVEFIRLLARYRVRYVIVGGEAVIYHGYPRTTGDIDFFYDNSATNARRLYAALLEFWSGKIPAVKHPDELSEPGLILQFGRPPNRIDLMNRIDCVSFTTAWRSRVQVHFRTANGTVRAYYIGRLLLIKNKKASGRPRDLEDARYLSD